MIEFPHPWRRNSDEAPIPPDTIWPPPRPQAPVPRDWEGRRLSTKVVIEINHLLSRIAAGAYSKSFIQELHSMGLQRFQRAYREGDQETMADIGPKSQALEHVLHTAFRGQPVAPDPKHLAYLDYLEQQARAEIEEEEIRQEIEDTVADIEDAEIIYEREYEHEPEEEDELAGLDPDIRAQLEPLSSDPEIAEVQTELRRLTLEMISAHEYGDLTPFEMRRLEQRTARTHEQLIELRDGQRRNPGYFYF